MGDRWPSRSLRRQQGGACLVERLQESPDCVPLTLCNRCGGRSTMKEWGAARVQHTDLWELTTSTTLCSSSPLISGSPLGFAPSPVSLCRSDLASNGWFEETRRGEGRGGGLGRGVTTQQHVLPGCYQPITTALPPLTSPPLSAGGASWHVRRCRESEGERRRQRMDVLFFFPSSFHLDPPPSLCLCAY